MKLFTDLTFPQTQIALFDSVDDLTVWASQNPQCLIISHLPGSRERAGQVKAIFATFPSLAERQQAALGLLQADRLASLNYQRHQTNQSVAKRIARSVI